ncbi:hypothetical protein OCS_04417 [Ophiocordyceps sinensis CO18]|uniref:Uncharacterized protein n=1 Tax=Ophiocordyceps sinensis (strain Co18 / CGMCC 3.14243) TaxID=911162 RepID=T5ADF4_OPHSC|nr:hypothetical protein OCS_04417 [Ophiocordyceps sinensis CO18]
MASSAAAVPSWPQQVVPNVLEVQLPQVVRPEEPLSPPILVSFGEARSDGNIPHMYQARLVISSIDGVAHDPGSPLATDIVLQGDASTPFAVRTADKLWFLFEDLEFKPEWEGHYFTFAIQLWACWYDKSIKTWEKEMYQGEIQTDVIFCSLTEEWEENGDLQAWDVAQAESIRAIAKKNPAATIGELSRKHPKITLQPDLLTGPWASPDRPTKRTG